MAKRKPTDMQGLDAVLPSSGVDLIANVIQSDRRRAGRGEFKEDREREQEHPDAEYDNMTSPMTSPMASPQTDTQSDSQSDTLVSLPVSPTADVLASTSADMQVRPSVRLQEDIVAGTPEDTLDHTHDENRTSDTAGHAPPTRDNQSATTTPRAERATGVGIARNRAATNHPPIPRAMETTRVKERTTAAVPRRDTPAAFLDQLLEQRIKRAKEMSNSRTMTVTLRLPQELNDWLDEYVHENWRDRVKKQQLVVEALQMLIARRGQAGEEVLPTELLGEGSGKDVL